MNQSSCPRLHPVLIAVSRSMVVPCTDHPQILDWLSTVSSDRSTLQLKNDVWHDIEPIGIRLYGQIRRIWDLIVKILDPHPPELYDIACWKTWCFRHSGAWQHHPKRYGAWNIKQRSNILWNKQAISYHVFEVEESRKTQFCVEHWNNGGFELLLPQLISKA